MKGERISYIDLGAGILILWMIIGHAIGEAFPMELHSYWGIPITDVSQLPANVHVYTDINGKITSMPPLVYFPYLFFFMPWFFYKSGQFFHKRSRRELFTKDFSKLLKTFFIWSLVGYVCYIIIGFGSGDFTLYRATYKVLATFILEGYIKLNAPLWFLLTLFVVRQVANKLLPQKDDKLYWIKVLVIIATGYLIGYCAYRWNHRYLPLWVVNGATGLAYFTMGYSMQKYEEKLWLIIPCVLAYVACCIWGFPLVSMYANNLHQGNYLLNMPACFAGIVIFNLLCRRLSRYLSMLSAPFEIIGRFAMVIYVTHGLIYESIGYAFYKFDLLELMPYTLWIIIGAYIIFLPLFCFLSTKIRN